MIMLCLMMIMITMINSINYYVSTTIGNDKNNGLQPNSPWKTIRKSSQMMKPGDTVYISTGEYHENINPSQSGNMNNYITYMNYENDRVVITNPGVDRAFDLSGKSYIIIDGLLFDGKKRFKESNIRHWGWIDSGNYNVIKNCEFKYARGFEGINVLGTSKYNKFINNIIDDCGSYDNGEGDDAGDCLSFEGQANYNLIEGNTFTHGGHNLMIVYTSYNVIRNNIFDNSYEDIIGPGKGNRVFEIKYDAEYNVVEGNVIKNVGIPIDTANPKGFKANGYNLIIRNNVIFDMVCTGITGATGEGSGDVSYKLKVYNNVLYNIGAPVITQEWKTSTSQTGKLRFKNNVVYKGRQNPPWDNYDSDIFLDIQNTLNPSGDPIGESEIKGNTIVTQNPGDGIINARGLGKKSITWWESNYPDSFSDNIEVIPDFVSTTFSEKKDFALKENSPLIDAGVFLTFTKNSGSGKNIEVEDAGYFFDGFGLVDGDLIQIGNNDPVRIISIDYSLNTIELEDSISWGNGDGVSTVYTGNKPDIGALEYGLVVTDDDDDDDNSSKNTLITAIVVSGIVVLILSLVVIIILIIVLKLFKKRTKGIRIRRAIKNASSCVDVKSEISGSTVGFDFQMEENINMISGVENVLS